MINTNMGFDYSYCKLVPRALASAMFPFCQQVSNEVSGVLSTNNKSSGLIPEPKIVGLFHIKIILYDHLYGLLR